MDLTSWHHLCIRPEWNLKQSFRFVWIERSRLFCYSVIELLVAALLRNENDDIINGVLVTNDDIIEYVGDEYADAVDRVIDGMGGYLYPGLINAHCHISSIEDVDAMVNNGITISTIQTLVDIDPDLYVNNFGTIMIHNTFAT